MAGVPHRQVVVTIPRRLRPWCLYRRPLLGDPARVAARTVTAAVPFTTDDDRRSLIAEASSAPKGATMSKRR